MYIKKFNESSYIDSESMSLRDLIGDLKDKKKSGYNTIYETTKGCFTNFSEIEEYLDGSFVIYRYENNTGDISIKSLNLDQRYAIQLYIYFIGDIPRIISTYPGDERGCCIFCDVFISSGHDGSYLWNVKTGEFKDNTW